MDFDIDLNEFAALLRERRKEILQRSSGREQAAAPVELDQARVGRLSRMDSLQQQAMARVTDERARTELARIESALRRIGAGEYGRCLRCGDLISVGRLRVSPAATVCIGCAEDAESSG